ncbi:MAG: MBL fold metallo-hydrolase [Clostridiales bacterium]|nr:MBL fold metallo-hydrolase [Clostridiales bacterium]
MFEWTILTVGHLSRNKFWGEDEETAYRLPLATCILLRGEGETIIIDPSLPAKEMAEALLNNSGLHLEDVTRVYSTHFHYDHHVDLDSFPNARKFMPKIDVDYLKSHRDEVMGMWTMLRSENVDVLEYAEDHLVSGMSMVPMPGHTAGISAYVFDTPEGKAMATGDAVMTREFYQHNESYFYCWNMQQAIDSIHHIKGMADLIIPGHGQPFLEKTYA